MNDYLMKLKVLIMKRSTMQAAQLVIMEVLTFQILRLG